MFELKKDGDLYWKDMEKEVRVSVIPCFPNKHKTKYLSIRDEESNEVEFIDDIMSLNDSQRSILKFALDLKNREQHILKFISIKDNIEIREFELETLSGKTKIFTKIEDWPQKRSDHLYEISDINDDIFIIDTNRLKKSCISKVSHLIE